MEEEKALKEECTPKEEVVSKDEASSMPYDLRDQTQSLFNTPKLSDIRFFVGGQTVYGHKQILALGSPVFGSMFFGELKEKREVIEIKDLTPVGFMNALSYIYGFPIDYELVSLYDSYVAADKYLLHGFSKAFFDYVKDNLNAECSCLIYDQLMKIGEREEISLASVRTTIIEGKETPFQSDYYLEIDQETLISLLSLDELRVAEIDLLTAVSKWVDCEVQREGMPVNCKNRRKVFEPIKGYIVFTALTPDQIANCKEVDELLTKEERGALALHLLDKSNQLIVEQKTKRKAGTGVCTILTSDPFVVGINSFSRKIALSADKKVSIRTIYTTYPQKATNLKFSIRDPAGACLKLKIQRWFKDPILCLSFVPPLALETVNSSYTLVISGHDVLCNEDRLSRQRQLKYDDSVTFDLSDYHCVIGLEFRLIE